MRQDWKLPGRILFVFVAIRLVLGIWMWEVRRLLPTNPANISIGLYKGVAQETNAWLEPWQRWDTPQYEAIASRGYTAFEDALFTPPLFPFLMRYSAPLFGGNFLVAGMIISSLAFFLYLVMVEKLARYELGNQEDSWRTVLYILSFPTAFFFFAAYTESLFLLAVVASIYAVRREKWVQAGIWGAMAALTRAPGFLICIPLAYAAWQAWKKGDRRGWPSVVITLLGAASFPIMVWFSVHKAPSEIISAVGRGGQLAFPGWNILVAIIRILKGQLIEENLLELIFTLLFICLTFFIWKKLPTLYTIYALTFIGLFITRLGSPQPLVSMARYVLEIFPAFIVLAMLGRRTWANRLILYLSWLGLLFFSAQFAIWGWVG